MLDAWNVSIPFIAEAVVQMGSLFETACCAVLDYFVLVWTSPSSVHFRENSISLVQTGIETVISCASQKPLLTTQAILSAVWIALFVSYRRQLLENLFGIISCCKSRLKLSYKKITQAMRRTMSFILQPFRKIALFLLSVRRRAGEFIFFALRTTHHPAPSAEHIDRSISSRVSSERSRSQGKSLSGNPRMDKGYEDMQNYVRDLRSQLEDERLLKLCVICHSNERVYMCAPCNHVCLCSECVALLPSEVKTCPICRTECRSTVKVYL